MSKTGQKAIEDAKALEAAKAAAEPSIDKKDQKTLDALESGISEMNGVSIEDQIEKYREYTNNIMMIADKVRESAGKVSKVLEGKFREAYNSLHILKQDYSAQNKRDGFKVLIERQGVDAKGFLVIDSGSRAEAYAMVDDIRKAKNDLHATGADSLVAVVSGLSENTLIAEIEASTIGGFAVQRYDVYPEYKAKKELFPLDNIPQQGQGLTGPMSGNTSLVK